MCTMAERAVRRARTILSSAQPGGAPAATTAAATSTTSTDADPLIRCVICTTRASGGAGIAGASSMEGARDRASPSRLEHIMRRPTHKTRENACGALPIDLPLRGGALGDVCEGWVRWKSNDYLLRRAVRVAGWRCAVGRESGIIMQHHTHIQREIARVRDPSHSVAAVTSPPRRKPRGDIQRCSTSQSSVHLV